MFCGLKSDVLLCILWLVSINTIYISIADLVANETSDSSKSVTNVITDTFTTELLKSYKPYENTHCKETTSL